MNPEPITRWVVEREDPDGWITLCSRSINESDAARYLQIFRTAHPDLKFFIVKEMTTRIRLEEEIFPFQCECAAEVVSDKTNERQLKERTSDDTEHQRG